MRGMLWRLLAIALWCGVVSATVAAPALAHGRGSDATNLRSRVTQEPDLDGVTWEVLGAGEFLSVRNDSDTEVTVLGYDGDADLYLRVGPEGVFRNVNSSATYLNETRLAQDAPPVPETANPATDPEWEKISDEPTYAWTDHRIHWESPAPPTGFEDATGPTEIFAWSVPVLFGNEPHQVQGTLEWVPPTPPFAFLALALLLTLPALLGLRAGGDATAPGWVHRAARPAAAVLGVVSLANLAQLYDDFFALPLAFGDAALKGLQTALFIVIGVFGAVRAWQGRDGAFAALGVGSIAIFVGQGLLYWTALASSQTTSAFPTAVSRMVIALSLAQLLPVGLLSLWGNNRIARTATDEPPGEGAAPEDPGPALADPPPA